MFNQALFAYLHYLSIITLIVTLVVEYVIFKPKMTYKEARTIQRADSLYGLSAILVLVTGFLRVIYFGKGWDYYFSNHIFNTKLGLFVIIGLLSIYPTRVFIKWRKELKKQEPYLEVPLDTASKVKRVILIQILLVVILPLLAALMARGIGYVA